MVRLKDIAAQAGVSVMTVSKVLRDAPDISAATKTRVKQLARDMGYVPDTVARGLRSRNTKLFGLLISSSTNPIFARVTMAVEEQSHELGYELILGHTLNRPEREEEYIRRFISRRVDGLFVTPVYRMQAEASIYADLHRRGIPTVILGHRAPFCRQFANVETDDLSASQMLTRHLIESGHRRIAFLAGPPVSPSAQERLEGYRRALQSSQIEWDDRLVFTAGSTVEEGKHAALQLLDEAPKATAVIGVNDLVAIGAASVFLEQGIRIPKQVSVAGFGNILTAEHFQVPLTTVRQPKFRLGVAAVETMEKLLRGESPGTKRLSAEILIRHSTGMPGEGI